MRTNISPRVAIMILTIVIIMIGVVYMKKASPGARQKEIDDGISSSVARGPSPVTKAATPAPKNK